MGEIRKVSAGEPFDPSTAWQHATVDAIRFMRHLQASGGAGASSGFGGPPVMIRNGSGAARAQFDVLGIDTSVFPTPTANLAGFKAGPALHGVKPTTAHLGRFAVLLHPAAKNEIVPACIAGPTLAKVDFSGGAYDFCDVKNGDCGALETSQSGTARILWPTSGTGVEWALVRIGETAGGAGASTIQFEVLAISTYWCEESDAACNAVTAEVLQISCGGAGVQVGDEVVVWDPEACHFDVPIESLIGAVGTASRMALDLTYGMECYDELAEEGSCRWICTGLSCCEEIYGCN